MYGQCLDSNCPQNMTCVSPTTSDCKCKSGFTIDPKSENCVDIDECEVECKKTSGCINTLGSYKCLCKNGYYEDGGNCKSMSVLVVSSNTPPKLISPAGDAVELPCFNKRDYHFACSVSWKNTMYLFGDKQRFDLQNKRISRLDGFSIKNVGELDFTFYGGSCCNINDEFIFLCFSRNENYRCRRGIDPLDRFTEIARPNMKHEDARISASRSKFNQLKLLNLIQLKFLLSVRRDYQVTRKLKYLTT